MSSDNGYVVRENKDGKYVLQMYFASNDEYPSIDDEGALKFDTLQEAVDFYARHNDEYESEYGLKIDIDFQPGKRYPLLRSYPEFCPYCGPGYRYGDEGCRHNPAQMKENKMQLQQFIRKPLVVEGIQVTDENLDEVSDWCDGEIHNEPKGKYIKVRVQNPLTQRQTKAFVGDWVLIFNQGFKVYTSSGLQNAFDSNEEASSGEYEGPDAVENVIMDALQAENDDIQPTVAPEGNIFDQPQELRATNETVNPNDQISGKQ